MPRRRAARDRAGALSSTVMILFLIKRSLTLAALLVGASLLLFLTMRGMAGEPVAAVATNPYLRAALDQLRERLGVELPLVAQYANWLAAALSGDLGRSGAAAAGGGDVLLQRLPVTLHLVAASLTLALFIAVPAGVITARNRGGGVDRFCRFIAFVGAAVPNFWQAMVMILVFAVLLRWFPASGYVSPDKDFILSAQHMLMPTLVLATGSAIAILCTMRAATIEAMGRDHLIVARAFGHSDRAVFWGQVLRHACASALAISGGVLAQLLAGAVMVETVFDLPGLGRLLVESIRTRDFAAMQGVALASVAAVLLFTLLGDALRALLDRRCRAGS